MKEYKYIYCNEIEKYNGWEIVQIIPDRDSDMAVVSKENKPAQTYVKLNEATNEQLIEELNRRIERK